MEYYQNALKTRTERFNYIRRNGLHHDCVFQVGHEIFYGHKLLLSTASPVFETMFYGSLPAAAEDPINIDDIEPEIFDLLLTYIYEKKFGGTSVEQAVHLMFAAKKYMIDSLEGECEFYLLENLDDENAFEIYELAKFFEYDVLHNFSMTYIIENTANVLNKCNYEKLSIESLLMLVKQDHLMIISESEIFAALERFAEIHGSKGPGSILSRRVKGNDEEVKIREVLMNIRFLAMSTADFEACSFHSMLLTMEEKFAISAKISARNNPEVRYPQGFCKILEPRNYAVSSHPLFRRCIHDFY